MNRFDVEVLSVLSRLRLRMVPRSDGGLEVRLVMKTSEEECEPLIDSRTVYVRDGRLVADEPPLEEEDQDDPDR